MQNKEHLAQAAIDSTSHSGGDVAMVETAPPVAVVVRHLKGDGQDVPSSCSVSIVEEMGGEATVSATNGAIVGCSLASSADDVKASTKVTIEKDKAHISGEAGKGSSEFDIYRDSDGTWYLSKAVFTYPEEDAASGDVIVIKETATFPNNGKALRFSDYSYDAIKASLSRTSIE